MSSRKKQKINEDGKAKSIDSAETADCDDAAVISNSHLGSRTLFVRSLSASTTDQDLVHLFSKRALVKHAVAVLDKDSKQCKGYGFVTFADREDAINAQAILDGASLNGRHIRIETAEPRRRESKDKSGVREEAQSPVDGKHIVQQKRRFVQHNDAASTRPISRLIIRNLPWSISNDKQLAQLFLSFGKITEVKLPRSKNGTLRGFGFVRLRGRKNAENAISQLNGKLVDGRNVAVDWSAPKDLWEESQAADVIQESADFEAGVPKSSEYALDTPYDIHSGHDDSRASSSMPSDNRSEAQSDVSDNTNESNTGEPVGPGPGPDRNNGFDSEDKSTTIFVRNLPFNVDDAALYDHFRRFGPLRYARVVMDHTGDTGGRSRGSGFVCFHKLDDAQQCLFKAPKQRSSVGVSDNLRQPLHSVLQDSNEDPEGMFTIEDRILRITPCVDRGQAQQLEADNRARREKDDKRHLYLLREGSVSDNSPLYALISATEVRMRETSSKQRQDLVRRNPLLHLSLTRLAVRNIPRYVTSKDLKALARQAVVGFAQDVQEGLREALTSEERRRDVIHRSQEEQKRKDSEGRKGIVRQAKVIFENRGGNKAEEQSDVSRSRGYGFIEYTSHRCALMGLRWLNGHLVSQSTDEPGSRGHLQANVSKRLIVEFAIENAQVVKRRRDREERSRQSLVSEASPRSGLHRTDSQGAFTSQHRLVANIQNQERENEPEDTNLDSKQAIRQRIIGRKRAKRRSRK